MIASNISKTPYDVFQGKSQAVQELYRLLLDELNKIGPVREIKKETSVAFENRKVFASALIRNRSIKLVLRTNHRISSPRIRYMEQVAGKSFDHTLFVESKYDIDEELVKWLQDAYRANQ